MILAHLAHSATLIKTYPMLTRLAEKEWAMYQQSSCAHTLGLYQSQTQIT
jgi:hypothetical protein